MIISILGHSFLELLVREKVRANNLKIRQIL